MAGRWERQGCMDVQENAFTQPDSAHLLFRPASQCTLPVPPCPRPTHPNPRTPQPKPFSCPRSSSTSAFGWRPLSVTAPSHSSRQMAHLTSCEGDWGRAVGGQHAWRPGWVGAPVVFVLPALGCVD